MTTPVPQKAPKHKMIPYREGGPIDYASLDFDASRKEVPPDHMEQRREIYAVINLLTARFTDFDRRPDVFLDTDTNICYDPTDLNVRVGPDYYFAFGVDARAIEQTKLYLPWAVGTPPPPDFVLEIASRGAGRKDITTKREGHAALGVPEPGGSTTQGADTMTYRSRGAAW